MFLFNLGIFSNTVKKCNMFDLTILLRSCIVRFSGLPLMLYFTVNTYISSMSFFSQFFIIKYTFLSWNSWILIYMIIKIYHYGRSFYLQHRIFLALLHNKSQGLGLYNPFSVPGTTCRRNPLLRSSTLLSADGDKLCLAWRYVTPSWRTPWMM